MEGARCSPLTPIRMRVNTHTHARKAQTVGPESVVRTFSSSAVFSLAMPCLVHI